MIFSKICVVLLKADAEGLHQTLQILKASYISSKSKHHLSVSAEHNPNVVESGYVFQDGEFYRIISLLGANFAAGNVYIVMRDG